MKIKMAPGNISCFFVLVLSALIADEVFCQKTVALSAKRPKGRVSLLNSYMPAAMQVLAHLTNQMQYDVKPSNTKPPAAVTTTIKTTTTAETTTTTEATVSSTAAESTASVAGDEMQSTTTRLEQTTQTHRPAIFAPIPPAKPQNINGHPLKTAIDEEDVVPPIIEDDASYGGALLIPYETSISVINPQNPIPAIENFPVLYQANPYVYVRSPHTPDTLFLPTDYQPEQFDPIARSGDDEEDKYPDISSLPVENENNFKYNPLEIEPDELSEENLQYLSNDVRNILRMERDFKVEKWTDASAFQTVEELFDDINGEQSAGDSNLRLTKASPSQSMIQMLLLYDLFSRDAKKQKLNNYHGYSEDMINDLIETSKGTAGDQLKTILERMLAKGDCTYDFANNRAKEMVKELEKPDSRISNEIRYLEPLRYTE